MSSPAVLMTDPRYFAIKGGANPHTRRSDNSLKRVRAERAWEQWHGYVDALLEAGVEVYIARAREELTGMVFAANAGFLERRLDERPAGEKTFYPSHFTAEHRRPESAAYTEFMDQFGFEIGTYAEELRFEGEADAFPVGRGRELEWVFTYGFRSDPGVGDWLEEEIFDEEAHRFELADPEYYHGDCLLCDLGGPLLGWPEGLVEESAERLREVFDGRFVELDDEEGANFIGNSFYVESAGDRLLFTSTEIRAETRRRIEQLDIDVVPVDVSEFFGKGGGGPKCMVFNLGPVGDAGVDAETRQFREARRVQNLRDQNYFPA